MGSSSEFVVSNDLLEHSPRARMLATSAHLSAPVCEQPSLSRCVAAGASWGPRRARSTGAMDAAGAPPAQETVSPAAEQPVRRGESPLSTFGATLVCTMLGRAPTHGRTHAHARTHVLRCRAPAVAPQAQEVALSPEQLEEAKLRARYGGIMPKKKASGLLPLSRKARGPRTRRAGRSTQGRTRSACGTCARRGAAPDPAALTSTLTLAPARRRLSLRTSTPQTGRFQRRAHDAAAPPWLRRSAPWSAGSR